MVNYTNKFNLVKCKLVSKLTEYPDTVFSLVTKYNTTYLFNAQTAEDKERWIRSIDIAIAVYW